MVDLTNRHFIVNDTAFPIIKFEVWFMTPFGITPQIEEAIKRCQDTDCDPELNITPVPVAIADNGYYEVILSRR